jgi:hypothetical protein
VDQVERYEVFLRIADSSEDCLYLIEHWFVERPETETVAALFEEAKRDFGVLYPHLEPEDFSVEVRRLRPADDHRPHPALYAPPRSAD